MSCCWDGDSTEAEDEAIVKTFGDSTIVLSDDWL
jgi:hypothetical protein